VAGKTVLRFVDPQFVTNDVPYVAARRRSDQLHSVVRSLGVGPPRSGVRAYTMPVRLPCCPRGRSDDGVRALTVIIRERTRGNERRPDGKTRSSSSTGLSPEIVGNDDQA
jgi:hypothetical protein